MTFDEWFAANGVPLKPGTGYSLRDASQRAWDAARKQALEDAARHFDERDTGAGGFYEPDEPAQIIRALKE